MVSKTTSQCESCSWTMNECKILPNKNSWKIMIILEFWLVFSNFTDLFVFSQRIVFNQYFPQSIEFESILDWYRVRHYIITRYTSKMCKSPTSMLKFELFDRFMLFFSLEERNSYERPFYREHACCCILFRGYSVPCMRFWESIRSILLVVLVHYVWVPTCSWSWGPAYGRNGMLIC